MKVLVDMYDKCKYEADGEEIASVECIIESYEVVKLTDEQAHARGFSKVDDYGEYLFLTLANGAGTSKFRNSYADLFILRTGITA